MEIKTYRAKTMRDALELVRRELGPSAAVLHTRELNSGLVRRMLFGRKYEVAASVGVNVPSRLPEEAGSWELEELGGRALQSLSIPAPSPRPRSSRSPPNSTIAASIAMTSVSRWPGNWTNCTRWWKSCASARPRRRRMICLKRCSMCLPT